MLSQSAAKSRNRGADPFDESAIENETKAPTDFLTVQDVARRLKCSRALVYVLCEKGKLNHHRLGLGRGTIRITESDLETFLQAAHVEPQRLTTAIGLKHIRLNAAGSR